MPLSDEYLTKLAVGRPVVPGPQGARGVDGTPGNPGANGATGIPGEDGNPGPAGESTANYLFTAQNTASSGTSISTTTVNYTSHGSGIIIVWLMANIARLVESATQGSLTIRLYVNGSGQPVKFVRFDAVNGIRGAGQIFLWVVAITTGSTAAFYANASGTLTTNAQLGNLRLLGLELT